MIWAQEEPKNMGSWGYISPFLRETLDEHGMEKVELKYVGRGFRASPATGQPKLHLEEQKKMVEDCF